MIRLTDGYATVTVEMKTWDERNQCYTPDRAPAFFGVRELPFNRSTQAYKVNDVNYCLEQAHDSMLHMGDFYDGFPGTPGDTLFVDGDIVIEVIEDGFYIEDDFYIG